MILYLFNWLFQTKQPPARAHEQKLVWSLVFVLFLIFYFLFFYQQNGHDWTTTTKNENTRSIVTLTIVPIVYVWFLMDYKHKCIKTIYSLLLKPLLRILDKNRINWKIKGVIVAVAYLLIFFSSVGTNKWGGFIVGSTFQIVFEKNAH